MIRFMNKLLVVSIMAALLASPAMAWKNYPENTADGLTRIKAKDADAVYWKEGATLADYERVRLDDAEVSFRKNWQRDQNREYRSLGSRVRDEDMEDIRNALAKLFREVFTAELEAGGYDVVDENGSDVLLLQPSIIDLDVNAPELNHSTAGRSRNYTTSAGEMTLSLDLRDSATNDLIGRAIDRKRDRESGHIQYTSKVTNRADATRILKNWAQGMVEALDNAKEN